MVAEEAAMEEHAAAEAQSAAACVQAAADLALAEETALQTSRTTGCKQLVTHQTGGPCKHTTSKWGGDGGGRAGGMPAQLATEEWNSSISRQDTANNAGRSHRRPLAC